jgi:signal transduction histidine kinase
VAADFSLDELLEDVIGSHTTIAARKSLTLKPMIPTGLILHTDRLRLERILNNLLGNAIKFTLTGSVHVEVESRSHLVEIGVVDTGIGIAPEHQRRLFEEFYQVQNHERDRQKGFGLGLAISNRLARQLGGEILVQSTSGQGSRFSIVIPAVLPANTKQTTDANEPQVATNGDARQASVAG